MNERVGASAGRDAVRSGAYHEDNEQGKQQILNEHNHEQQLLCGRPGSQRSLSRALCIL
ncbi:hypothetical protein ACFTAO_12320 [Paenibacillus rhizoplanae]